jgi:hypothetical protein
MKSKTLGIAVGVLLVAVLFVVMQLPRTHALPQGYTDTYFPRGGHRYLIAPGGVKKVGQEVVNYQVVGTVVTGTVRLRLERDDVRTFHLDLKTHTVSLGDPVQEDAR